MSRIKRATSWCIILTTFVAFAAVLLGGMAGMGSAATVSQVASSLLKSKDPSEGSLVVVGADNNDNHQLDSLSGSNSNTAVCWVTKAQAAAIRTHWVTTTTRINGRFSLLTINAPGVAPGVTVTALRAYVSGGVKCQIVHQRWAFYVPLDGAVS